MGGVPTGHHTKSKTGRRRSHLARKKVNIGVCPACKAPRLSHRACSQCGAGAK
jgi:large subunit ribosomal protein L32